VLGGHLEWLLLSTAFAAAESTLVRRYVALLGGSDSVANSSSAKAK